MELSTRREGRFTASEISRLMGKAGFESYVAEVAAIRDCGRVAGCGEGRSTWAMDRGNEYEEEARQAYAASIAPFELVRTSGMVHPQCQTLWATPDSLVEDPCRCTVDFKVPLPKTWYAVLATAEKAAENGVKDHGEIVDTAYYWQAQCQMAVYSAGGHFLVYYNPLRKSGSKMLVFNILRNNADIEKMLARVAEAESRLARWGLPFVETEPVECVF